MTSSIVHWLWNPNAPDNILVRHRTVQRMKSDPSSFERERKAIARLSRSRRGRVPQKPTIEQLRTFVDECRAAGFDVPPIIARRLESDDAR